MPWRIWEIFKSLVSVIYQHENNKSMTSLRTDAEMAIVVQCERLGQFVKMMLNTSIKNYTFHWTASAGDGTKEIE